MKNFKDRMRDNQIQWRRENLLNQEKGKQNAGYCDHVLPPNLWQQNLWPGINDDSENSLPAYLLKEKIKRHTGTHNLLSSWIVCANLYFPFREKYGRQLLLGFLRQVISDQIISVDKVELEHAFQKKHLSPNTLLGETDGYRGAGQTSPDVAFEVSTENGSGVVLVECKFTEHSFYPCSGRKQKNQGRPQNSAPHRCKDFIGVIDNPALQCHLNSWGRKYWITW